MMAEGSKVGLRLQCLRKERDLTQRDLAGRAGLSANAISLIERDEISPSVATLQRLATALSVKISYFFEENEEQANVLHVKTHQRPSIVGEGVSIEALGRRLRGQEMDPFLISLAPQAKSGSQPVTHAGHELVYCLRGSIEYEVDGNIYMLEEGDILFFEAEMPHLWQNPTPEAAEFLLILQAPDESAEPVRRHFPAYPSLSHIG
jgi:transcriptional regulator with XRE-family HTH domain